jgi:hypothetical protein
MTAVKLTCESEEIPAAERADGPGYRPLIKANGQAIWRGRPEASAADAERVALEYLRYALGGLLTGPPEGRGGAPAADDEPRATDPAAIVSEALEALGREVAGALRRVGDLLERGDWRRFLGG